MAGCIFETLGDFIDKMKIIGKICQRSFLVTADVVGLYPRIPQNGSILALKIYINIYFLRPKISNHLFGCATLTISFLCGRMEKQNLKKVYGETELT